MRRAVSVLAAGMVFCSTAYGEAIPSGCYVTDAWRIAYSGYFDPTIDYAPPPCYVASDNFYQWWGPDQASGSELVGLYGSAMATIISSDYAAKVQMGINYDGYKKQLALVKKLRKACGTRCKKIK